VSFKLILGDDRRIDKVANRSKSADTQARNFLSRCRSVTDFYKQIAQLV
jgi:hypothetical protein